MNNESSPLELRLLNLLQRIRDERDADARAELNTLLRTDADARRMMAATLVNEQALIHHLRDASIVSILKPAPASAVPVRSSRWLTWRPLAAAAAGIVFGMLCTSVVWAGVALFRRGPEPMAVALANADFDTFGKMKLGGFPKSEGYWSGDACAVVCCVLLTIGFILKNYFNEMP